jgi:lysozyme
MLSPEESIIIEHLLMEDEGIKQFPYVDCCAKHWKKCSCKEKGNLTIGVGRNLDALGLSENEVAGLLSNDVKRVTALVERNFPWIKKISTPRRIVIISMVFNIGLEGFKEFQKMIKCIESGDFLSAAREMLNSKWATQVKGRATRLSLIMKTGDF